MSENEHWTEAFRETLHNHEEPYQLGAWERFEAHRSARIRRRMWRQALSVAALLLMGLGLYWFGTPGLDPGREVVHYDDELPVVREPEFRSTEPVPENDNRESEAANRSDEAAEGSVDDRSGESEMESDEPGGEDSSFRPVFPEGDFAIATRNGSTDESNDAEGEETFDPMFIDSPITGTGTGLTVPTVSMRSGGNPSASFQRDRKDHFQMSRPLDRTGVREEQSSNESPAIRASDLRPARQDQEFAWGVAYAPVMNLHGGTARMAMGAGVHARVGLGNSWGLGSALVLSRSQFRSDADPGEVNLFQTSSMADGATTILDSRVEADLVSLEVPLHLRYEVSESVAFSGGLSTVAYLQETYHYRVDYRQPFLSTMSTEQGVRFETEERRQTERVSESERPMSGFYWGAFYNMGAEFSWLFSERHWVSVEPFVKIPTGGVAKQDLTYSSGGVQLKLYF
ncbi:MAG: hypothetical protein ACQER4_06795 [Bacteroidota bacterium]